ncbi:hypothetical protein [Tuwongella immobilis]|uniref:Lipoprotein n=1 Tax=Tuwongella immobilis TaxID=692036 RepID=A0A6C2YN09_9BACT|nr:hypothetical protein [Tuwongella immobilis]VIP02292.1 Uncharacterized protein OS=Pirellula staleyi (strain ATCC 27377 / DSM 6068 / ICPB 4128) GN=Psta_0317 PE=4 SV=1 [Tuwongella immobilis]VTS00962.1 Uncharacterized protein OS=Pirellula staleyi (strain ATCC 27377 / DSM 6068 / ICPB 4128) GN=Psta_0317 PE=4 SV=1 [Tuwongella immobilis]
MTDIRNHRRIPGRYLLAAVLLSSIGCGGSGPQTVPFSGKISLVGGNLEQLAGSAVEVAKVDDPAVRGFGEIQPDGQFQLASLIQGELREGVLPGQYQVRILPNSEDGESYRRSAKAVARRFLQFETSGLKVNVPDSQVVTLAISAK